MREKQLVAELMALESPGVRQVATMLARIDQSLTGKDDQAVWHTLRNQWDKLETIILGRDVYYLSDGGISRLSIDCTEKMAFVTANSTPRVKWLWEYETGMAFQLKNALITWMDEYQEDRE